MTLAFKNTPARFEALFKGLDKEFRSKASKEKAAAMSKYLKNQFEFLGLMKPVRGPLDKKWISLIKAQNQKEVQQIFDFFWNLKPREYHYFAQEFLFKNLKLLDKNQLPWIHSILIKNSWWDTIDPLSTKALGRYLLIYPELQDQMDQWILSDNFWIRRSAIIFQLMYKEKTDWHRLKNYCLLCAHEKEFFIRKAIGWALRQYAKTETDLVLSFLDQAIEIQGLSRREALRHFK